MEFRRRHRIKSKKVEEYSKAIKEKLGDSPFEEDMPVDTADTDEGSVLLLKEKAIAAFFDEEVFPTVNGLLQCEPTKSYVTVDMGAVSYLYNGADVMAPGIVDADEDIEKGDLVWVRDVEHKKPLAVGRAKTDGKDMVKSEEGKVVKSLHHVGDGRFD